MANMLVNVQNVSPLKSRLIKAGAYLLLAVVIFLAGVYVGRNEFAKEVVHKETTNTVEKPTINEIHYGQTTTGSISVAQKPTITTTDPNTGKPVTKPDPNVPDVTADVKYGTLRVSFNGDKPVNVPYTTKYNSFFEDNQLKFKAQMDADFKITAPVPSKLDALAIYSPSTGNWGGGLTYRPNPKNGFGVSAFGIDSHAYLMMSAPIGNLWTHEEKKKEK